jgi:hypothetical protein
MTNWLERLIFSMNRLSHFFIGVNMVWSEQDPRSSKGKTIVLVIFLQNLLIQPQTSADDIICTHFSQDAVCRKIFEEMFFVSTKWTMFLQNIWRNVLCINQLNNVSSKYLKKSCSYQPTEQCFFKLVLICALRFSRWYFQFIIQLGSKCYSGVAILITYEGHMFNICVVKWLAYVINECLTSNCTLNRNKTKHAEYCFCDAMFGTRMIKTVTKSISYDLQIFIPDSQNKNAE